MVDCNVEFGKSGIVAASIVHGGVGACGICSH